MSPEIVLVATGAIAAGYVNGLAGFGTALFSLGFWLQAFPPLQAVAMSVVVATVTGLQGLWVVRREIPGQKARILRFLVPSLIGLPLGFLALSYIEPRGLKLLIAGFMLAYALFFLARRSLPKFERPTPAADMGIGVLAGFLGGLAGLSGALPAMWCALRPWPRAVTRAVMQPLNFVVLLVAVITFALRGVYDAEVLRALALALPLSLVAAQAGLWTFKMISDTQFRWLIIALMLVSGVALMGRELW